LEKHGCLSLAGTSDVALLFFLNQHSEVKELVFCLGNAEPGLEAAATMARKYADKGLPLS
jgi:esterase/lipase superfamily enzyme